MPYITAKELAKRERQIKRLEQRIAQYDQAYGDTSLRNATLRKTNEGLYEKLTQKDKTILDVESARKDLLRQLRNKDEELAQVNRRLVRANAEAILWHDLAALRTDTLAQMDVLLGRWQDLAHG